MAASLIDSVKCSHSKWVFKIENPMPPENSPDQPYAKDPILIAAELAERVQQSILPLSGFRLNRALAEIFTNACDGFLTRKHTQPESLGAEENLVITVVLKQMDSGIKLTVTDNGAGFTTREKGTRFKYHNLDQTRKNKNIGQEGGDGVGLTWYINQITTRYKGTVTIRNRKDHGCSIETFLPASKAGSLRFPEHLDASVERSDSSSAAEGEGDEKISAPIFWKALLRTTSALLEQHKNDKHQYQETCKEFLAQLPRKAKECFLEIFKKENEKIGCPRMTDHEFLEKISPELHLARIAAINEYLLALYPEEPRAGL